MLSCRELVEQTDEILAGHMTWRERLSVRVHLLMCRHCARYLAQYRRLVALLPGVADHAGEDEVDRVMAGLEAQEKPPTGRT